MKLKSLVAALLLIVGQSALAAFPTVNSFVEGAAPSSLSSHSVVLPATVADDDLLLVVFTSAHNSTVTWDNTTAGTWTSLFNILDGTGNVRYVGFWKQADGTEDGATLTVTTNQTVSATWQGWAISGWHTSSPPEISSTDHGAVSSADVATLTPSWGSADTLYIATVGWDRPSGIPSITGYPASYTNTDDSSTSGTRGGGTASARREVTGTSENPGSFTFSAADDVITVLIGIRPTGGGGGGGGNMLLRRRRS